MLVDFPVGIPGACWAMMIFSAHTQASHLTHKAERRQRSQPGEPLSRIGGDLKLSFVRADHHIENPGPIFDQRKNPAPSALSWMRQPRSRGDPISQRSLARL